MPFKANIILDSVGPAGNRLTTIEFTIPKLWNGEFNTHCMFARNSASTRAIPFDKQLTRMMEDTFVPTEWPLENPGMAAKKNEEDPNQIRVLQSIWKHFQVSAVHYAKVLAQGHGIHKQLAGRLLELFQFHTVLVTGDEASFANFFHQRRDKGAAPEIREAANRIWEVYKASTPSQLRAGEWHLPLLRPEDYNDNVYWPTYYKKVTNWDVLCRVSAARCARLSYLTHHGLRDTKEDLNLFRKLTTAGHWSPLEHVCQALSPVGWFRRTILKLFHGDPQRQSKWNGWASLRKTYPQEYITHYTGD